MGKKSSDAKSGTKLLALFFQLLFSGRKYSLSELAEKLDCSKPTVMRLLDQLAESGIGGLEDWIDDSDRKRWVRLNPPKRIPRIPLRPEDIRNLMLCRDMVWHLLPKDFREQTGRSIGLAAQLISENKNIDPSGVLAQAKHKGSIDYTEKSDQLNELLSAMEEHRICVIRYDSPGKGKITKHLAVPSRLIVQKDALYVRCQRFTENDLSSPTEPMTLSLKRIDSVDATIETHEVSEQEDSPYFGIYDEEPFQVKIAFSRSAAPYVAERVWNEDQKMEDDGDGGVVLGFTAKSMQEVVAMVLGFGADAIALEPELLVETVKGSLAKSISQYNGPSSR